MATTLVSMEHYKIFKLITPSKEKAANSLNVPN